jgi:iron complex outermembrane recepter protein
MKPVSITLLLILILSSIRVTAQDFISGTIKDEDGEAIIGATIVIRDTKIYAVSDFSGNFKLQAPSQFPVTLTIQYVGYETLEIVVATLPEKPLEISIIEGKQLSEIVITARRREETVQSVPIPIAVVGGALIDDAGAFNVNRVKELVPSVQLYSSNPRNTTLNIRGLGSTFGLTNDGIDPGVGFYVDGVYFARPAATTLDFIDIERIEVLRGPQGTLFGKNTTAGALNITTRRPSFKPAGTFEMSYGNYGYIQAKSSITGPILKKLAGRLSFSGTQRDGVLENVVTLKSVNDINNLGVRGQLLYLPSGKTTILLSGDFSRQRPDGFAQVVAGVAPTLRADFRQFNNIIADLGYALPSLNPYDRKIDHDTPWKSGNDLAGVSLNIDSKLGPGTLTATSAWRWWNWDPSNDRDFTGLKALSLSQAPSVHNQWSQELRYSGDISEKLSGVIGAYFIGQNLKTNPFHTEEAGPVQWRFVQNNQNPLWQTPGLLDGYGIRTYSTLNTISAALFAQVDWEVFKGFHILPGVRYNYDQKEVEFRRETYGGLQTDDPALIALKNSVYNNQEFEADVKRGNFSGQVTLSYQRERINAFATYANNFKPVGLNLGGLPSINGQVAIELATILPENVQHYEVGVKTSPSNNATLNLTLYNTTIKDFQTLVQTAELGVNRGYLANAEKVRVRGLELEGSVEIKSAFKLFGSFAFTDGKYVSFENAPVPLEETGGPQAFKDISGGDLPGISKWSGTLGGEYSRDAKFLGKEGKFVVAAETFYRSGFSSSPSPSQHLNIDGYALLNARIGFRSQKGPSFFVWGRNLLNKDYMEQLLPGAGNAGHYAAVLGDPLTFGATIRYSF